MTNPQSGSRPRDCVLAFLFAAALASTAVAQETRLDAGAGVPVHRETMVCQDLRVPEDVYNKFVRSYYGLEEGNWQSFQGTAVSIINGLKCEGRPPLPATHDAWYFFLFPEEIPYVPGGRVRQIIYHRALVHTAPSPTFQSTRIIYVKGRDDKDTFLYDVHVIPYEGALVDTDYTATPVEHPVIGGIKKALALVVASWPSGMPAVSTKVAVEEEREKGAELSFKVSVTKITLPFGLHRASITLTDSAEDTPAIDSTTLAPEVSVPGSSTYYLAPLTYLEIGLGAAYITRTALNQAAKVDSSLNLVDATPTTFLTYVAANWRPWGYDESSRRRDWRQDFRIVIGPALTPNPGFVFGVGYAPWAALRPFSIQAGFGILLANVLRSGDTLGKPPQNPAHPTKRGGLGVWFIGLGYGLQ